MFNKIKEFSGINELIDPTIEELREIQASKGLLIIEKVRIAKEIYAIKDDKVYMYIRGKEIELPEDKKIIGWIDPIDLIGCIITTDETDNSKKFYQPGMDFKVDKIFSYHKSENYLISKELKDKYCPNATSYNIGKRLVIAIEESNLNIAECVIGDKVGNFNAISNIIMKIIIHGDDTMTEASKSTVIEVIEDYLLELYVNNKHKYMDFEVNDNTLKVYTNSSRVIIDDIRNAMKAKDHGKVLTGLKETKIKSLKASIEDKDRMIADHLERIGESHNQLTDLVARLSGYEAMEDRIKIDNPLVNSIVNIDNKLEIRTKFISFKFQPKKHTGEPFTINLGKMLITYGLSNNQCYIYNLTREIENKSAIHIGTNNNPCLGGFIDHLSTAIKNGDYAMLVNMLIGSLTSIDESDTYGRRWHLWLQDDEQKRYKKWRADNGN